MQNNMSVILLKSLVVLPYQEVRLELSNEISKKSAMLAAKNYDNKVLVVCPIDQMEETPEESDLPLIGVVGKIKSKIELPNGNLRIVIKGLERVDVKKYINSDEDEDILLAQIEKIELVKYEELVEEATRRKLISMLEEYVKNNSFSSNNILALAKNAKSIEKVTDVITVFLNFPVEKQLEYMNEVNALKRAEKLIEDLFIENEVVSLENKIDQTLNSHFQDQERELLIKEKIKLLTKELNGSDNDTNIIESYYERLNSINISNKSKTKLKKEINYLESINESNPEAAMIRNYLDWVLFLPWNEETKDTSSIKEIRTSLNSTHYGLDKAKDVIIEYIAAKKLNSNLNAPILCFDGPPGVGKTTFAKSVADSLCREFYKISVGGLNDSLELIGNRRSYLGALPGKIIQAIKKCNTKNPVILIDEVDKMVKDYKGDPASTLLEILDMEQNKYFIDNYIEEPFDLSKVLFILTSNDKYDIPWILRNRLEFVNLEAYTELEKLDIAKKHLIPQILQEHNMVNKIKFKDAAILKIINDCTFEAGLRSLKRLLTKIVRKIIVKEYDNIDKISININASDIPKYIEDFIYKEMRLPKTYPGIVNQLTVGAGVGTVMIVESVLIPKKGNTTITGNVKLPIKEVTDVAMAYIMSKAKKFDIDMHILDNNYIHFHYNPIDRPIGGSSGGLAITSAIISLLKKKVIPRDVAMTGEISLTGQVLPIGALKAKLTAAYNDGIKTIFIPKDNEEDLKEVPEKIIKKLNIKIVSNYEEIYQELFS